jgi:HK97 gp10 family phage protein
MAKGTSFNIANGALQDFNVRFSKTVNKYDKLMKSRVAAATRLVWTTAHAKRPMITKAEMKATGRSHRVSDPNAQAGVPVDTGRLQGSIVQKVESKDMMSYTGTVETKGVPYAGFMEYGFSTKKDTRVPARPFMRPAVYLNKEFIKRAFGARVTGNDLDR